jgi:hypothetical protein
MSANMPMTNPTLQQNAPCNTPPTTDPQQLSWLIKSSRLLFQPSIDKYIQTRNNTRPGPVSLADNLPYSINPVFYQPYGTFMDFSKNVYLEPRIFNPRAAPPAQQPSNLDDYLIKTEMKNEALIASTLGDFIILDKASTNR